ncbi:MAG: hypothetical protein IJP11_04550, partial [Oscillospiraceae bacterium]|nr:hypothetical protein [Oscillospiraceae bacterium]
IKWRYGIKMTMKMTTNSQNPVITMLLQFQMRVSGVKKTVRWTVVRREVRSSYAARTDDARLCRSGIIPHPLPKRKAATKVAAFSFCIFHSSTFIIHDSFIYAAFLNAK